MSAPGVSYVAGRHLSCGESVAGYEFGIMQERAVVINAENERRTAGVVFNADRDLNEFTGSGFDFADFDGRRHVVDLDRSGNDDQVIHELPGTVALLPDVVDEHLYDVADLQGVVVLRPGGLLDVDGPVGSACLALEDQGPAVLVELCVGASALGTDDVKKTSRSDTNNTLKIGDVIEVFINDVGKKGDGTGKFMDYLVVVPGTVKGAKVNAKITNISAKTAFAQRTNEAPTR